MIGKVVYVGRGQVADAHNGNLVSLRQLTAEWNAMVDAWYDIRVITAKMARFARMNQSWPCGEDVASMARAIDTALDRVKTASVQQQNARPGNAAAMREALRKIMGLFRDIDLTIDCPENEAYSIAASALSAPARNCDKMPDIANLTMHDLAKSPCKSTLEYASRKELLALVRWLLAPAAERKGEGDGR